MKKTDELNRIAQASALSAEIASENIRKYLELHRGAAAKFVMKIADEMTNSISQQVDASAELAAKHLQEYLRFKKK